MINDRFLNKGSNQMNYSSDKFKSLLIEHKNFLAYGIISVAVTVIDVIVSRGSEGLFGMVVDSVSAVPVIANATGVVTGFIIQYFLTAKFVYNTKSSKSFVVFLATFFMNLLFATAIVFLFRTVIFDNSDSMIVFLISKGASIVLPFFATYFIRKKLMPTEQEEK